MKILRYKNIITIEVELSDCRPGEDIEIVADAIATGMQTILEHPEAASSLAPTVLEQPEIGEAIMKATGDLLERWEK